MGRVCTGACHPHLGAGKEMVMDAAANLFGDLPDHLPEELYATLLHGISFRVERIVSQGHASPPDFWYDQEGNEWVMVVEDNAAIQFEGDAKPLELRRGEYLNIPAHTKHRVVWTDPDHKTVWPAIHYRE